MRTGFWKAQPEGKRPIGRPKRRKKDNVKMNIKETRRKGLDWSDLTQDRNKWQAVVNAVMNY
jgi:hypothetical protein